MSQSSKKFSLVICELHNKNIHGFTKESDANVQGHYLVTETFDQQKVNIKKINKICKMYTKQYGQLSPNLLDHPILRNYPNIVANDKYTFEIDYNCTKKEIASLIKKIFNVDVKKVNIINSFGKTKRFKGIVGSKSDIKKAIITLQTGQKINFD